MKPKPKVRKFLPTLVCPRGRPIFCVFVYHGRFHQVSGDCRRSILLLVPRATQSCESRLLWYMLAKTQLTTPTLVPGCCLEILDFGLIVILCSISIAADRIYDLPPLIDYNPLACRSPESVGIATPVTSSLAPCAAMDFFLEYLANDIQRQI